jgi:hypothetical protein
VHVGSLRGVCVLQVKVFVVTFRVFRYTVAIALLRVVVDMVVIVTFEGVTVDVLVIVVLGSVNREVLGNSVVRIEDVLVKLIVIEGVTVIFQTAVGVAVIVVWGPATMVKVRIQEKEVPCTTI